MSRSQSRKQSRSRVTVMQRFRDSWTHWRRMSTLRHQVKQLRRLQEQRDLELEREALETQLFPPLVMEPPQPEPERWYPPTPEELSLPEPPLLEPETEEPPPPATEQLLFLLSQPPASSPDSER